jgi:anti-sigma regulatory factor (Ser/Thr protein kinase)
MSVQPPDDPFVFTLALKPVPQAARLARETIAVALALWQSDEQRVDTGKLLVSELVTNAVAASADDQEITLRTFLGDDGRPVIEVWDAVDEEPVLRQTDQDDESGRGLMLVEALAKRWGTNAVVGGGKVIWAVLG